MFKCDNSLLAARSGCVASGVSEYCLGRIGKGDKEAADVGNMSHDWMEVHFRGGSPGDVAAKFHAGYDKLFPATKPPTEERFSRNNLQVIMEEFVKRNPLEPTQTVKEYPFKPMTFEQVVGFDLCEGVRFYAKRDMLVEEKQTGLVMPLDHKTTRLIREWWQKKWRFSSQMLGYAWATGQETGNLPSHVVVNAVELGNLPRSNYKCKKHKMKFSECYRQHVNFQVLKYQIQPEMVERWLATAILQAKQAKMEFQVYGSPEMIQHAPRTGLFTGACTFCGLKDWCRTDFRADKMEHLTVGHRWAPWDEAVGEAVVVPEGEVLAPSVSTEPEERGLNWYYNPKTGKIWVSKVPLTGFTLMTQEMALKALWQQGKDAWMEVWQTYPIAQEAMADYGRRQA